MFFDVEQDLFQIPEANEAGRCACGCDESQTEWGDLPLEASSQSTSAASYFDLNDDKG